MITRAFESVKELFSLKGRRAVVTGGGGGIGSAIARGFAEFGADIALIDLDAESMERVKGELESHGYVVFIPPNVKHCFRNLGEEKLSFICLIPHKK